MKNLLKGNKAEEEYCRCAVLLADGADAQALYQFANITYWRDDYYNAKKYVGEVLYLKEINLEALWLALHIERKLVDLQAEMSLGPQFRRKFADSLEHQVIMQGKYE